MICVQAEEEQAATMSAAMSELRSHMEGILNERTQLKDHIQQLQASKASMEDVLRAEQATAADDRSRVAQVWLCLLFLVFAVVRTKVLFECFSCHTSSVCLPMVLYSAH